MKSETFETEIWSAVINRRWETGSDPGALPFSASLPHFFWPPVLLGCLADICMRMRSGPSRQPGVGCPLTKMVILWGVASSVQKLCRGVHQMLRARCRRGPVFDLKLVISTRREEGDGVTTGVPRGAAHKPQPPTCSPTLPSLVDHIGACTHLHTCTHACSHILHSPDEGGTNNRNLTPSLTTLRATAEFVFRHYRPNKITSGF